MTALYDVRLRAGAGGHVADARVRWLDPATRVPSENVASVTVNDIDESFGSASLRLKVVYTAGFFAEVLRQSPYGQDVRLRDLAALASSLAEQTEDAQVAELADLIGLAMDAQG